MKNKNKFQLLFGAASLAVLITGCQQASPTPSPSTQVPALLSDADAKAAPAPAKGRAQLWSQTCNRCHNTRSPDTYGAREWAIVMTHMRVRGYLTGDDQRAILEFLQSQ